MHDLEIQAVIDKKKNSNKFNANSIFLFLPRSHTSDPG